MYTLQDTGDDRPAKRRPVVQQDRSGAVENIPLDWTEANLVTFLQVRPMYLKRPRKRTAEGIGTIGWTK